jgi:Uma2 family endonuclease
MELTLGNKPLIEPYSIYIPEKTFEDLLDFANEDLVCELLDGVLVIRSPASFLHESIVQFLTFLLRQYGNAHSLGIPVGSHFAMKLSDTWAPEPDIVFLTPTDQESLQENYLDGPASEVFEVLSKSTRSDDIDKKLPQYLQYGVQEVWFIDPESQVVTIYWNDSSEAYEGDSWAQSQIIPGFRVRVSWFWDPNNVSIIDAVTEIENLK